MTTLDDMTQEVAELTITVVNRHGRPDIMADRHTVRIFARAYVLGCLELERVHRQKHGVRTDVVENVATWWREVADAYEPKR